MRSAAKCPIDHNSPDPIRAGGGSLLIIDPNIKLLCFMRKLGLRPAVSIGLGKLSIPHWARL